MDQHYSSVEKLINYKKENYEMLKKWFELISQAKKEIFSQSCLKSAIQVFCDPLHCVFRDTGECKYFEELEKLEEIISIR